jgi:hypothetical protein
MKAAPKTRAWANLFVLTAFWSIWCGALAAAPQPQVIGRWRDALMRAEISISRAGSTYTEKLVFDDGSKVIHRLAPRGGRRYVDLDSPTGDYLQIDAQKNLALYDKDGYIRTVERLK